MVAPTASQEKVEPQDTVSRPGLKVGLIGACRDQVCPFHRAVLPSVLTAMHQFDDRHVRCPAPGV